MVKYNMNKKIILAFLVTIIVQLGSFAQSPEKEVEAVIRSLFEGMKNKDPELVKAAFSESALMQTVQAKPEGSTLGSNSVADFVNRIATTPAETVLDEQILDYQIKVDGTMASAWTPYKFFVNGNFSHCGVNSFQLVKMAEGWKIVYIIDTRRKENCN